LSNQKNFCCAQRGRREFWGGVKDGLKKLRKGKFQMKPRCLFASFDMEDREGAGEKRRQATVEWRSNREGGEGNRLRGAEKKIQKSGRKSTKRTTSIIGKGEQNSDRQRRKENPRGSGRIFCCKIPVQGKSRRGKKVKRKMRCRPYVRAGKPGGEEKTVYKGKGSTMRMQGTPDRAGWVDKNQEEWGTYQGKCPRPNHKEERKRH